MRASAFFLVALFALDARAEIQLSETVTRSLGEALESCVDSHLQLHYVLYQQQFGRPELERDTVVLYNRERGTLHIAMYGTADTSDEAKKRLESRKKGIDFAVNQCAKNLAKKPDEVYSTIEMTYAKIDRENGKQKPLLRWYRGRWELL